jgi:hypothetical protein
VKDGHALEGLNTSKQPTATQTRDLEAVAKDFDSLIPSAPAAIKPDITTAAHAYTALAIAVKTKNLSKFQAAAVAFGSSGAVEDLLKVQTYELHHCDAA